MLSIKDQDPPPGAFLGAHAFAGLTREAEGGGLRSEESTLKDVGSQYTAIYTIYTSFPKVMNHILYIYVFEIFSSTFMLCQGENKNIFILDIDNQNITCVSASKGNQSCMFELQSLTTSKYLTCSNSALEEHVNLREGSILM